MTLNIDITTGRLIEDQTAPAILDTLILSHGDKFTLSLRMLTPSGDAADPWDVTTIPAAYDTIVFGARTRKNLAEEGFLFSCTDFDATGSGDSLLYTGTLELNTDALAEKFPDTNKITRDLAALLDIELQDAGNTIRETLVKQWPVTIKRGVIRGDEGVPEDADPPYPAADGRTILYGTAAPTTEGSNGDFYIRTTTSYIYGPKAAGSWPAGTSLVGPQGDPGADGDDGAAGAAGATGATGATGAAGADGKTILYGTAAPTTEGVNGDFYIRTTTNYLYGPKAAGVWPSGTSLVGPTGATGATGSTGAAGAAAVMKVSTSYTVTFGTGSKTFNFGSEPNLGWVVGMRLRAAKTSAPTTDYMDGVITSVSTTSVTMTVDHSTGTGDNLSWNIGVAGERGASGSATIYKARMVANVYADCYPQEGDGILILDQETDPNGLYNPSNGRITAPSNGTLIIGGCVAFEYGGTNPGWVTLAWQGDTFAGDTTVAQHNFAAGGYWSLPFTDQRSMTSGQYDRLYLSQENTARLGVQDDDSMQTGNTYLWLLFIPD